MKNSNTLAVLILAAGSSFRLGEPKQLLKYKQKTLLWHACFKALQVTTEVYVVLGKHEDLCKESIKDLDVNIVLNKEYEKGISFSIKAGVQKLLEYEKVLIMLCDQPFIPLSHLKKLIENRSENITASFYHEDVAVPAVFPKKEYAKLLNLEGDSGAKKVIRKSRHIKIDLEEKYAFDIDTNEDKEILNKEIKDDKNS